MGIIPVLWSPFVLSLDSTSQLDLLRCLPCLVLNDFWLAPKVICVLQGGRFTALGDTVTSQLTNPRGAELFYNKVLILKVRLTPSKSWRAGWLECTTWTVMPSANAPVCPCPVQTKPWSHTRLRLPLFTLPPWAQRIFPFCPHFNSLHSSSRNLFHSLKPPVVYTR